MGCIQKEKREDGRNSSSTTEKTMTQECPTFFSLYNNGVSPNILKLYVISNQFNANFISALNKPLSTTHITPALCFLTNRLQKRDPTLYSKETRNVDVENVGIQCEYYCTTPKYSSSNFGCSVSTNHINKKPY